MKELLHFSSFEVTCKDGRDVCAWHSLGKDFLLRLFCLVGGFSCSVVVSIALGKCRLSNPSSK